MPRKNFATYAEAKAIALEQGITHREAWRRLAKKSKEAGHVLNIPINAEVYYGDEFEGWSKFLGQTRRLSVTPPKKRRDFAEATRTVQALNFSTVQQYREWAKSSACPEDIPRDPARAYAAEGWEGYPAFLGTNPATGSKKQFDSFRVARTWAREHLIANSNHWRELAEIGKLPKSLPVHPNLTYARQWKGWERFLGPVYRIRKKDSFAPFEEAAAWAKTSGIRNSVEWRKRSKRLPEGIPSHPELFYSESWRGWPSFLGVPVYHARVRASIVPLEVAQTWCEVHAVKSASDWRKRHSAGLLPSGYPSDPSRAYGSQWRDWYQFLGKEYPPRSVSPGQEKPTSKGGRELSCNFAHLADKSVASGLPIALVALKISP